MKQQTRRSPHTRMQRARSPSANQAKSRERLFYADILPLAWQARSLSLSTHLHWCSTILGDGTLLSPKHTPVTQYSFLSLPSDSQRPSPKVTPELRSCARLNVRQPKHGVLTGQRLLRPTIYASTSLSSVTQPSRDQTRHTPRQAHHLIDDSLQISLEAHQPCHHHQVKSNSTIKEEGDWGQVSSPFLHQGRRLLSVLLPSTIKHIGLEVELLRPRGRLETRPRVRGVAEVGMEREGITLLTITRKLRAPAQPAMCRGEAFPNGDAPRATPFREIYESHSYEIGEY